MGRLGGRAPPGAGASIWRLRRSLASAATSVAVEDARDKEYYAIARCGLVGCEESGAENGVGGIITFVALARIA